MVRVQPTLPKFLVKLFYIARVAKREGTGFTRQHCAGSNPASGIFLLEKGKKVNQQMKTLTLEEEMIKKTVKTVELIRAEDYRTYSHYICITFDDDTRIMLAGRVPINPRPDLEEMINASNYFTPKEIKDKQDDIAWAKKTREAMKRRDEIEQYKKLAEKYGNINANKCLTQSKRN